MDSWEPRLDASSGECEQTAPPAPLECVASNADAWMSEEVALEQGWLRECPYHGEPFKSAFAPAPADTLRRRDSEQACSEDALHAAARLANGYAAVCRFCERENGLSD